MTPPFRVLIADSMSSRADEILGASQAVSFDRRAGISPDELLECIGDYNGLLVRSRTKVNAQVIKRAHNLKVIGRAGIGVDNIDVPAATARGIIVENAPKGNVTTTAEHAICLLLSLLRHIPTATASMKKNKWEKKKLQGTEMCGKTFAVIGLGNIGKIVAKLGAGLQMHVVAYDPFCSAETASELGVKLLSMDDVLAQADFLSVHTPLIEQTRGLIGSREFAKMKPGTFLVNAARGGIVDEQACVEALNSGQLAGAAFDVFAEEPVPPDNALVMHPKVVCTPHIAASTAEAQIKVAVCVAEQMVLFAENGEIRNGLNAEKISS